MSRRSFETVKDMADIGFHETHTRTCSSLVASIMDVSSRRAALCRKADRHVGGFVHRVGASGGDCDLGLGSIDDSLQDSLQGNGAFVLED